jgi:DNA-binding response OmpR family regulator
VRLLVAEDDRALRDVLLRGLRDHGFQVDGVDRGDDAIEMLGFNEYDVAVLDWRMPGRSGVEVVAWIRDRKLPTAALMLTARDTPAERVQGLDAGADDYLVKPFDFGELLARIRALQRRPRGVESPVLARGRLRLDPARREVHADGTEVRLTPTEYRILELLMRRTPSVVSRRLIAQHAWDDETQPLGSNAIDVQVSRIRAKIVGSGVRIITVRGAGYRLEGEA